MMKPLQAKGNRNLCSKISIASIDFKGTAFNLGFPSKNRKFQTKFGGYLTLFTCLAVFLVFILSASQLLFNNSPVVNIAPEFNPETVDINLYEDDLVMPLMFKKGNKLISSTEELSRYFTVRILAMDWVFDNSISWYTLRNLEEFPLVVCSELGQKSRKIIKLIDNLFRNSKSVKKYLFCPDLGDKSEFLKLKKNHNSADLAFIRVRFYPCTLTDTSKCATAAELDDIEVTFYSNKKIVEACNFDQPVKYTPKRYKLKVDRSTRKIVKFNFDPNVLVDDSTQIRAAKTRQEFASVTRDGDNTRSRNPNILRCTSEEISLGVYTHCDHFLEMEFLPRTDIIKIRRSYKKASIVLGEFGGYLKLLMSLILVMYTINSSQKIRLYLLDQLIPGQDKTEPKISEIEEKTKNNTKQTKTSSSMDLLESLIDVNEFVKNLNLAEILQREFLDDHDESLINQSILKARIIDDKKREKMKLESKKEKSVVINQIKMKKKLKNTQKKRLKSLKDSYQLIKSSHLAESSQTRKRINDFILRNLKSDLDSDYIKKNNFLQEHSELVLSNI